MHQLRRTTILPCTLDEAWEFFSSPLNLKRITPPYMGFDLLGGLPDKMYEGQIIQYHVSPLLRIKMKWVTEITHIREKEFFVDEQRVGPYTMWHHEHHFKALPNGVEMTDIVSYKLPLGWLGNLFHPIVVKPQLNDIFDYRTEAIQIIFPNQR